MINKKLTVKRETEKVFSIISNFPYWNDGTCISVRVAFNKAGKLSTMTAQRIDAENGNKYLLATPMSFNQIAVVATAKSLYIGDFETVLL